MSQRKKLFCIDENAVCKPFSSWNSLGACTSINGIPLSITDVNVFPNPFVM
jgi:hypothetical protein